MGLGHEAHPDDGLRAEHLSIRYPGTSHFALSNVSLHLPAGTTLGLVGQNGSGKTTLVKLLTGLYRPTTGRVLLDGLDLREWNPVALRRRFAVLFQDFTRYQFTLSENIGVGDASSLEDARRCETAASEAGLTDMISHLPRGMDTQLGHWFDDGVGLSGGQWQGVAASRIWMRSTADILILDEPTSAMDALAEAELLARVKALMINRTSIVISHRLTTLRHASEIILVDQGAVRERGSHETLIAADGHYALMFQSQASGYR